MSHAFAWSAITGGIRLAVRVNPRGGRDAVEGLGADAEGDPHIKVRVSAAPVDGAANESVEKTIAKWLGIKARDVEVVGGETNRAKLLRIDGDPIALIRKLQTMTEAKA